MTFAKSTSQNYPLAVNIAQSAKYYQEGTIEKKIYHFVCFEKSREDAGRAHALMHYISGWKGARVFTGGKLVQNFWEVTQVLECYLEASGCNDWRAHCYKMIDDPYLPSTENRSLSISISLTSKKNIKQKRDIDRFIFPCKFLHQLFRFQIDHPSSPENQIQAGAVETGCDWCPNFDAQSFEKKGARTIIEDVFE